jgi:hypothetical protein
VTHDVLSFHLAACGFCTRVVNPERTELPTDARTAMCPRASFIPCRRASRTVYVICSTAPCGDSLGARKSVWRRASAEPGLSSLKEFRLSSGFSRSFHFRFSHQRVYTLRRSSRLRFLASSFWPVVGSVGAFGSKARRLIAQGLIIESGRSRSFPGDCTSSHPFVNPLALRQVPRLKDPGRRAR